MHAHGIVGSLGRGTVVTDPDQRLRNRIASEIEAVLHRPAEGRKVIDNVVIEPLDAGIALRVTLGQNVRTFTRSHQLQASVYLFDLVKANRGVLPSPPASLVDNLDQTDPYAAGFGGPEDNDGNRKASD